MMPRPSPAPPLDLVVIGNLIVDDLVFDDGTTRMGEAGGAVVYAALGAALWGARVGIVSVAGQDYPPAAFDAMAARGIDLAGVRWLDGPGLRAWLLYEPGARRLVHRLGRPTHEQGSPGATDVPPAWLAARTVHLTPAPLTSQAALVRDLSALTGARISLDPHTPVEDTSLAQWRTTLAAVDIFFVSEEELQLEGPPGDDGAAAAALAAAVDRVRSGRLDVVAVKRGSRGGLLLRAHEAPVAWEPRVTHIVDPTGAGDAFAGGFLAALLRGTSVARALAQGVIAASFAMEDWGAARLLATTPDEAARRLAAWFPQLD